MTPVATQRRVPFYLSITTLVLVVVVTLTALFLWISHKESSQAAISTSDTIFSEVNEKMVERYRNALGSVAVLAGSAVLMPGMSNNPVSDGMAHPALPVMLKFLDHYTYLFSLYTGYSNGNFLQVIAPRANPDILAAYDAPVATHLIVRCIASDGAGRRKQSWRFLDRDRRIIERRMDADPAYDPRKRPWYRKALGSNKAIFTDPYVFSSSRLPGITCAEELFPKNGVFGADITLERFAQSLQRQKVSENSALFLFDFEGRLIGHSQARLAETIVSETNGNKTEALRFLKGSEVDDPVTRHIVSAYEAQAGLSFDKTHMIDIQGATYLAHLSSLSDELGFDQIIGSVAPLTDFTGHIRRMQQRTAVLSVLVLLAVMPLAFWMARRFSRSLTRLEKEADRVRRFDFSESEPFDSMVKEIHSLIQAFGVMKLTIRQRTDALIATQNKLEKLVESGIALSAERDVQRLLEMIFASAKELSYSDGGVLFLRDKEDTLRFEIMQTAEQDMIHPDAMRNGPIVKPLALYDPQTGAENHIHVESHVALSGQTVRSDAVSDKDRFQYSDACRLDETTGVRCSSFLTVPLKPRQAESIGVLQLFNPKSSRTGESTPFETEITGFVEALAAQAAVALHNKKLLEEQRELFNAFIRLIAEAIDAKSPYTGGHCERVPEVALMLAQAVSDVTEGPFADFKLQTEDEWREFRVAAWLHDCGKVTTPEFVVDKATKLECIYNRIHEIRTRFEVLWRDAELEYYRKRIGGGHAEAVLAAELQAKKDNLREDFAFVSACNLGGEFVADETIERLEKIAAQKWMRHFDDRLGLSQEESLIKNVTPEQVLPVEENLLADKPEHIVPRTGEDIFEGNPYGFKMEIPENLYHRGELYNLSIRKGTLTVEDRFKINEHIIQTIKMLEKLPFPDYLTNVPEFAGAHHETMDGKGYPRKLTREEMSIPARIMAIADIFEALTASDRPYKKPQTLSESLRIMSLMRDDRHIDAGLFELFLKSGVYKAYAEKFLDPGQIDDVAIEQFLGPTR